MVLLNLVQGHLSKDVKRTYAMYGGLNRVRRVRAA